MKADCAKSYCCVSLDTNLSIPIHPQTDVYSFVTCSFEIMFELLWRQRHKTDVNKNDLSAHSFIHRSAGETSGNWIRPNDCFSMVTVASAMTLFPPCLLLRSFNFPTLIACLFLLCLHSHYVWETGSGRKRISIWSIQNSAQLPELHFEQWNVPLLSDSSQFLEVAALQLQLKSQDLLQPDCLFVCSFVARSYICVTNSAKLSKIFICQCVGSRRAWGHSTQTEPWTRCSESVGSASRVLSKGPRRLVLPLFLRGKDNLADRRDRNRAPRA